MFKYLPVLLIAAGSTFTYAQDTTTASEKPTTKSQARKNSQAKQALVNSGQFYKHVKYLEKGFNQFSSYYAIKDFLASGKVNFIEVTYGTNPSSNGATAVTHTYFIQTSAREDTYRELFFGGPYAGKDKPLSETSRAILKEAIADDPALSAEVDALEKISKSKVKAIVKKYNETHK